MFNILGGAARNRSPCFRDSIQRTSSIVHVRAKTNIRTIVKNMHSGNSQALPDNAYPFRIATITDLSPTVKGYELKEETPAHGNGSFSCRAGQWVDFFISELPRPGGFSVVSTENDLKAKGLVSLALKTSDNPPTKWMHEKAKVGDLVHMATGGTFVYPPDGREIDPSTYKLLMFAGGIGINPLYSIMRLVSQDKVPIDMELHYSASHDEELIFREEMEREFGARVVCYVSQKQGPEAKEENMFRRRIDFSDISSAVAGEILNRLGLDGALTVMVANGGPEHVLCYICGPPQMIEDVSGNLHKVGVSEDNIIYEKWW